MGRSQLHDFPVFLDQQMAVACAHVEGVPFPGKPFLQRFDQNRGVLRADLPGTVVQDLPVLIALLFF